MTRAIEMGKQAGLPTRAWKREIEAFHALARADYEAKLSAVMPADFKDWHENDRSEWPELAAWVITNLREQRVDLEAENAKLREALVKAEAALVRVEHLIGGGDDEVSIESEILIARAALGETK